MIDLLALSYALLVLEHGSFRKAATVLGVRPSVVSRSIRSLEDAIGVSVFHRRNQGAEPTLAGQQILRRGRTIIDDIGQLLRAANLSSTGRVGSLCVGVVATIAGGTVRELLRAFLAAHADIDLRRGIAIGAHRRGARAQDGPDVCRRVAIHAGMRDRADVVGTDPGVQTRPVRRDGLMALVGLGRGISLVGAAEAEIAYPGVVFRPLKGEFLPYNAVWSEQNDNPVLRRFLSLARTSIKTLV